MMAEFLCITVHFLGQDSHGRDENGEPQWPPSPLRVLQALVAASAGRWNERITLDHATKAIRWLESLPPPRIIAAPTVQSTTPRRHYVPDNVADKVAASWARGGEADIANHRTEKDVLPTHLEGDAIHYVYDLPESPRDWDDLVDILISAARSMTHLGWGIDMVIGNASIIQSGDMEKLRGHRWIPSFSGGKPLRTPRQGTLDDLMHRHTRFLQRLSNDTFHPVPPLREFTVVHYRREDQPQERPYRVFELRNPDGSRRRYPHARLIHIAGMVRHLAIEAMKQDPPADVNEQWVETYVAGHRAPGPKNKDGSDIDNEGHQQISYLPLPSLGHRYTDPGIRRVMITAPAGHQAWLGYIARKIAGQTLRPLRGDEFAGEDAPLLLPVQHDPVARMYTAKSAVWHSFTPVILPGHDDHKPDKTRALIERALLQSGLTHPCDFEWSAFSRFPKTYSAHKYNRDKRPQGYIRPTYLISQTAVHLTLRFHDGSPEKQPVQVSGPIVIGAGRHCGLGLLAADLSV